MMKSYKEQSSHSPFSSKEQKRRRHSHTQRFDLLMRMLRINRMLKNARILPPAVHRRGGGVELKIWKGCAESIESLEFGV